MDTLTTPKQPIIHDRNGYFISFLSFLFVYILIAGSENNWNYIEYRGIYEWLTEDNSTYEKFFTYCIIFFRDHGLSIEEIFVILNSLVILMLYYASFSLIKGKTWIFFILFFMFPGLNERSAMRSFIATGFITIAISILTEYKLKRFLISFVLIYTATEFHRNTYLMYLYLVIPFLLKKIARFDVVFNSLLLGLALYFVLLPIIYSNIAVISTLFFEDIIGSENKLVYLTSKGDFGFLLYTTIQIVYTYLLYTLRKECLVRGIGKDSPLIILTEYTIIVSIFLLFLVPFYRVNNNYFRLYYCVIPIIYILCIGMNNFLRKVESQNVLFFSLILLANTTFLTILYTPQIYFSLNVLSLLSENYFFNIIRNLLGIV